MTGGCSPQPDQINLTEKTGELQVNLLKMNGSSQKQKKKMASSSTSGGKYRFENGILLLDGQTNNPNIPLAILSHPDDLVQASVAYADTYGTGLVILPNTVKAMETTDEHVLEQLGVLFGRYEVPIGLLAKLLMLKDYDLFFILDDSGSMESQTDLFTDEYVSEYMRTRGDPRMRMTRWMEQEDRLHLVIDFISCIPTGKITITFLNRSHRYLIPEPKRLSPQEKSDGLHSFIRDAFQTKPGGNTPIHARIQEALRITTKTSIYLFTDGVPTDISVADLKRTLCYRSMPEMTPMTLVSCTSDDSEIAWMKEVDEEAKFMSEIDDYKSERAEVIRKQGNGFPYSQGLWIMCLLVASMNPYDLDALDESTPLTHESLSNLMGRWLTTEEYASYMRQRPVRRMSMMASWLKKKLVSS